MSSNAQTDTQNSETASQNGTAALGNLPHDIDLAARARTHLLVVEDEPTIRQLFATLLTAAGYSVSEAENGFAALEEVRRRRPALILSDLNMPRMTGFELLSVIRRRFPSIRVIAMSGAFSGDSVPDGVSADAFYEKSGRHINTLVDVIEDILVDPSVDGKRTEPARQAPSPVPSQPPSLPSVALWVTRRGNPIEGTYILLTCQECLRSFPFHPEENRTMQVRQTPCVFCSAPISYALLDHSISHHPGYAPSKAR